MVAPARRFHHEFLSRVYARNSLPKDKLHPVLPVKSFIVEKDLFDFFLAEPQLLGQRRSVVWLCILGPNDPDGAIPINCTNALDRRCACKSGSYHEIIAVLSAHLSSFLIPHNDRNSFRKAALSVNSPLQKSVPVTGDI